MASNKRNLTEAQQAAMAALIAGMWTPERCAALSALMVSLWNDYEQEPRYRKIRHQLQQASEARRRG